MHSAGNIWAFSLAFRLNMSHSSRVLIRVASQKGPLVSAQAPPCSGDLGTNAGWCTKQARRRSHVARIWWRLTVQTNASTVAEEDSKGLGTTGYGKGSMPR